VVLYEMLTGDLPFGGENYNEVMLNIVSCAAPDPLSINPEIPRELGDVVLRALAEEPEDRFVDASDFASALAQSIDRNDMLEAAFGAQLPPPSPNRKPARRRRLKRIKVALITLIVVLFGGLVGVISLVLVSNRDNTNVAVGSPTKAPTKVEPAGTAPDLARPDLVDEGPVEVRLGGLPERSVVTFNEVPVKEGRISGKRGRSGMLKVKTEGYEDILMVLDLDEDREMDLSELLTLKAIPSEPIASPEAGSSNPIKPPIKRPSQGNGTSVHSEEPVKEGTGRTKRPVPGGTKVITDGYPGLPGSGSAGE
jgi:hypothetical protein